MINFNKQKQRMLLEKKLMKKQEQAEKNKAKVMKDQLKKIQEKFLTPVEIIKQKNIMEDAKDNKERIHLIQEA